MAKVTDILFATQARVIPNVYPWTNRFSTFSSAVGWNNAIPSDGVWNGNVFAIVGAGGGQDKVATSTTGTSWTLQPGYTNNFLNTKRMITVGTDIWTVYTFTAKLRQSTDNGVTWTEYSPVIPSWSGGFNDLIWNGTQFLALGDGAGGQIATSATGTGGWTRTTIGGSWGGGVVNSGIWDPINSRYVLFGIGRCVTGTPGAWTWQGVSWNAAAGAATQPYTAAINGTTIVVAIAASAIVYSTDSGVNWTRVNLNTLPNWGTGNSTTSVMWDGSKFVVCGAKGRIATSPDGITWTAHNGLYTSTWGEVQVTRVIYNGSTYVAIGSWGSIATSTDAINWINQPPVTASWETTTAYSICWNGTTALAAGAYGKLNISTDAGASWTYSSGISNAIGLQQVNEVIWTGPTSAIAVGAQSRCATTNDSGATWTLQSALQTAWSNTLTAANSVATDGSIIVVAGDSGRIATSTDGGVTWTNQTSGFGFSSITHVIWSGGSLGKFVAVGFQGKCATSSDGITWTLGGTIISGTTAINSVAYAGVMLIAVGNNGACARSIDGGATWNNYSTQFQLAFGTDNAQSIVYNQAQGLFLAVGDSGKAATTLDATSWADQNNPALGANYYNTATSTSTMYSVAWNGTNYIAVGSFVGTNGLCVTSP